MLLKKFNLVCLRHLAKHKNILLHRTNNIKFCSTTINKKKNEFKFDGPSLKDFIAKDLPAEASEIVNNEDKIPYIEIDNLGQNRKGINF